MKSRSLKGLFAVIVSVLFLISCSSVSKSEFKEMSTHVYTNVTYKKLFNSTVNAFNDNQLNVEKKDMDNRYIQANGILDNGNFFTKIMGIPTAKFKSYTANFNTKNNGDIELRLNIQNGNRTVTDKEEYKALFDDINQELENK